MLLRHNADFNVTDEYGKTPRQTAELSSKKNVVHILRSAGKVRNSKMRACVHAQVFIIVIKICMHMLDIVGCIQSFLAT